MLTAIFFTFLLTIAATIAGAVVVDNHPRLSVADAEGIKLLTGGAAVVLAVGAVCGMALKAIG